MPRYRLDIKIENSGTRSTWSTRAASAKEAVEMNPNGVSVERVWKLVAVAHPGPAIIEYMEDEDDDPCEDGKCGCRPDCLCACHDEEESDQ